MPGRVKVRVVAGRNLPVMDRANETTDAYVEVRFGSTIHKTEVCRKTLCPQWNSEWFRFEVDDASLQDDPLQIRVMDHDTYSANDAIGKVYVDLNPLLLPSFVRSTVESRGPCTAGGAVMNGWIPIYDTIHGLRGELNIVVKVDFISNFNKYRKSSCGVQMFYSQNVPAGYILAAVHGFVEELVVNDDPEYQWIDKIRTPRASNEARQLLFRKLSGEIQRKMGLKALEMGGNAILGYKVCFDLEGESGVVVRGIGTSATICRSLGVGGAEISPDLPLPALSSSVQLRESEDGGQHRPSVSSTSPSRISPHSSFHGRQPLRKTSSGGPPPSGLPQPPSPVYARRPTLYRGGPSGGDLEGRGDFPLKYIHPVSRTGREHIGILEYPFLTMSRYPDEFILKLGGTVSSRSVKLLDRIHNPDEPETRDAWWTELRMEIRSHAKALACNVVLGYEEKTSIWEEVCILSASGTAALVAGVQYNDPALLTCGIVGYPLPHYPRSGSVRKDSDRSTSSASGSQDGSPDIAGDDRDSGPSFFSMDSNPCSMCHVPYGEYSSPFPVNLKRCQVCWSGRVPDNLLITIEPPSKVPRVGIGTLIQGRVSRLVKDCKGEQLAKEISDSLPFLEYEMYRQLINKLRVKGMNCITGLKTQISIGENTLIGVATGTACYFSALSPPTIPKIMSSHSSSTLSANSECSVSDIQKKLSDLVNANKKTFGLDKVAELTEYQKAANERINRMSESEDDHLPHLDFSAGNKDTCVLEIDDCEDLDVINLLMDPRPPLNFEVSNIEDEPRESGKQDDESVTITEGLSSRGGEELPQNQLFTKIWQGTVPQPFQSKDLSRLMDHLIHGICYRFRKADPKVVRMARFNVAPLDEDELQITITGVCLGTQIFSNCPSWKKLSMSNEVSIASDAETVRRVSTSDVIHVNGSAGLSKPESQEVLQVPDVEPCDRSSVVSRVSAPVDGPAPVIITPLSWIEGKKTESYLGNLNFFFIRETMNVKEVGGLSIFISSFVAEVMSIARAHVRALGGNALLSYDMSECVLMHSSHKSQAQCLINVHGDVAKVVEEVAA